MEHSSPRLTLSLLQKYCWYLPCHAIKHNRSYLTLAASPIQYSLSRRPATSMRKMEEWWRCGSEALEVKKGSVAQHQWTRDIFLVLRHNRRVATLPESYKWQWCMVNPCCVRRRCWGLSTFQTLKIPGSCPKSWHGIEVAVPELNWAFSAPLIHEE